MNTPAPRFAPTSPAEPGGEAAFAPPRPLLTGEGELAERPAGPEAAAPLPAATGEEAVYSCPMHPEVKEKAPGKCRICGMTLVKQEPKR